MTRSQLRLFDVTLVAVFLFLVAFMVSRCSAQCPHGESCPTQPQRGPWSGGGGSFKYDLPRNYGPEFIPQNKGSARADLYAAVCQVSAVHRDGSKAMGSGVLVDMHGRWKEGIVITANHVVPEGTAGISVKFVSDTRSYAATLWKRDTKNDIAALMIPMPNVPAIRIAERFSAGEACTLAGWGGTPRKGFFAHRASIVKFTPEQIWVSSTSSKGDSGGLIINSRGRIAGVISRTSDPHAQYGYTVGASYGPLRWLLGLPPRWEYREEYRRRNAPPPQQFQAPQPQQGPQGQLAPILPDTSNLVTKAEYERDKAFVLAELDRRGIKLGEEVEEAKAETASLTADALKVAKAYAEEGREGGRQAAIEAVTERVPDHLLRGMDLAVSIANNPQVQKVAGGKLNELIGPELTAKIGAGVSAAAALRDEVKGIASEVEATAEDAKGAGAEAAKEAIAGVSEEIAEVKADTASAANKGLLGSVLGALGLAGAAGTGLGLRKLAIDAVKSKGLAAAGAAVAGPAGAAIGLGLAQMLKAADKNGNGVATDDAIEIVKNALS